MAFCKTEMWGKLIILSVLVLGAVAIETTVTETHHNEVLKGESGETCTKVGRKCVFNATCENHRCHCPDGQKGNAEIECVDKDEKLCYFSGDPHVTTFSNAGGTVSWPCRFRATRFLVPNNHAITHHGSCTIEVHAINELINGRYRIRAVHITVSIGFDAQNSHHVAEIFKTVEFNVNDTEIYNYQTQVKQTDTVWGTPGNNIDGITIKPSFDEVNNFAMLELPQCYTRIKYRASDQFRPLHPRQLPGLTIMVSETATFVPGMGDYPASVCGAPSDPRSVFLDRAEQLNLPDKSHAILYDVLANEPAQTDNELSGLCEASISLFKTSNDQEQDIRTCGFLLTKGKLGSCLETSKLIPIAVFNACMALQQNINANCTNLENAFSKCGTHPDWSSGLKNINCP